MSDQGLQNPVYLFGRPEETESRRLAALSEQLDPASVRVLERLGISSGAACLEIGAGDGSIAR